MARSFAVNVDGFTSLSGAFQTANIELDGNRRHIIQRERYGEFRTGKSSSARLLGVQLSSFRASCASTCIYVQMVRQYLVWPQIQEAWKDGQNGKTSQARCPTPGMRRRNHLFRWGDAAEGRSGIMVLRSCGYKILRLGSGFVLVAWLFSSVGHACLAHAP
ncbi:hypothetical protein PsYK624_157990 [Phanerochaete sordida]|uniref:Uncharacterized protein n=1 Tax=Phanerochaete sordida TaxID=48140 RepID=A0A9P3GQ89_9APHY|nr:hypothetical protein PsYK624_157990 [Phanerochaete sordida]